MIEHQEDSQIQRWVVLWASCNNLLQESCGNVDEHTPWKILWKTIAPPKLACYGWMIAHDARLPQHMLQRKKSADEQMPFHFLVKTLLKQYGTYFLHCH